MQLSCLNSYDLGVGCGESPGGCSGSSFGGDGGHVAILDALFGWTFGKSLSPDELAYLQGQVAAICISEDRLLDCIRLLVKRLALHSLDPEAFVGAVGLSIVALLRGTHRRGGDASLVMSRRGSYLTLSDGWMECWEPVFAGTIYRKSSIPLRGGM